MRVVRLQHLVPAVSSVMPAKAGTQRRLRCAGALGPRFRGGDEKEKMGITCLVRTTSGANQTFRTQAATARLLRSARNDPLRTEVEKRGN